MKMLSKDARGFIEEVAMYVRSDARAKTVAPRVTSLLTKVTAAAKREQNAQVKSAVALLEPEKKRIEAVLVRLLGHSVECQYSIDESLVGGIKIQVADWIVDSSLTTQVASIARSILSV
ncbi:MAG: F0F1 ATP synthase subunit delta [Candidatus Gottesmanbacteria bacterium]|nr:F0F1 ATP synthase subunit delta [Candidatus Gottesmanbacteria bacterium]